MSPTCCIWLLDRQGSSDNSPLKVPRMTEQVFPPPPLQGSEPEFSALRVSSVCSSAPSKHRHAGAHTRAGALTHAGDHTHTCTRELSHIFTGSSHTHLVAQVSDPRLSVARSTGASTRRSWREVAKGE